MTVAPQSADPAAATPLAQCASAVLMIRPAAFGVNPETVVTNAFQAASVPGEDVRESAKAEFDGVVDVLERAGVEAIVVDDLADPPKPDAVFPNNWLSLHHDGTAVLYPMLSPLRRRERRRDVIAALELMERGRSAAQILPSGMRARSV